MPLNYCTILCPGDARNASNVPPPAPALVTEPGQEAGFIILDGIRMLCEKMYTLILHFNFYTNIILVFKFIKGILFFLDLNGETRGKNNAL